MKTTWKTVNSLLGQKGKIEVITKLQTERGNLTTPNGKASYLYKYFCNEEAKLCEDARKKNNNKQVPKIVQPEVLVNTRMTFNPCDVNEVVKIINGVHPNSSGVDGISQKIAKSVQSVITPILRHLVNKSMEKGLLLEALKVHKGGKRDDPSNKRPISILSSLF